MKTHPVDGVKILNRFDELTQEADVIVSQHHERHDGQGYPKGLKGDQIHMYAQICSIADVFDALSAKRPYRDGYSTFNALKIMKDEVFKDFDPVFFQKFVKLFLKT